LFCSDDCRSWPCEEKFWSDDCRSWPREEKINNHGCWGKHAHIPDNGFKSKSQNIWQQIIMFSSTVMQMIWEWHKIWTLSGRLSLMRNVQLMKTKIYIYIPHIKWKYSAIFAFHITLNTCQRILISTLIACMSHISRLKEKLLQFEEKICDPLTRVIQ
jgi:hypothetical protein